MQLTKKHKIHSPLLGSYLQTTVIAQVQSLQEQRCEGKVINGDESTCKIIVIHKKFDFSDQASHTITQYFDR